MFSNNGFAPNCWVILTADNTVTPIWWTKKHFKNANTPIEYERVQEIDEIIVQPV